MTNKDIKKTGDFLWAVEQMKNGKIMTTPDVDDTWVFLLKRGMIYQIDIIFDSMMFWFGDLETIESDWTFGKETVFTKMIMKNELRRISFD